MPPSSSSLLLTRNVSLPPRLPQDGAELCKACIEAVFGEWGEVESVNVINKKAIAFVRFRHRCTAEFAREAMHRQSLNGPRAPESAVLKSAKLSAHAKAVQEAALNVDDNSLLNIRWAYDDPNPAAKRAKHEANQRAALAAMRAKGLQLADEEKLRAGDGAEIAKARTAIDFPKGYDADFTAATGHEESEATAAYPTTDAQYGEEEGAKKRRIE